MSLTDDPKPAGWETVGAQQKIRQLEADLAEAVALLGDSDDDACDAMLEGDPDDSYPLDDPASHECSDVDGGNTTPCWQHRRLAFLARVGKGTP